MKVAPLSRQDVAQLKEQYPKGTRIELRNMEDIPGAFVDIGHQGMGIVLPVAYNLYVQRKSICINVPEHKPTGLV